MRPTLTPAASIVDLQRAVVVACRFVPGTPITFSRRDGSPWNRLARRPKARRESPTWITGTPIDASVSAGTRPVSTTIAPAPAATACARKRWPSDCVPFTATNSPPGDTRRESSVSPVISRSRLPCILTPSRPSAHSRSFIALQESDLAPFGARCPDGAQPAPQSARTREPPQYLTSSRLYHHPRTHRLHG